MISVTDLEALYTAIGLDRPAQGTEFFGHIQYFRYNGNKIIIRKTVVYNASRFVVQVAKVAYLRYLYALGIQERYVFVCG